MAGNTTDLEYYSNEKLMAVAMAYADEHVICAEDCPYTPADAKHIVRDAYYAGFEDFYKTIIKPMHDAFIRAKSEGNPYNETYKLALEDIIMISGFEK